MKEPGDSQTHKHSLEFGKKITYNVVNIRNRILRYFAFALVGIYENLDNGD